MKALRLIGSGEPLVLEDVPLPEPGPGQVLVQVAGCGVCHTDVGFWKEGVPTRGSLPLTLGHEISGTVVEAGPGASDLLDRPVIVPAVIPCGECALCAAGRGNICQRQVMPGNDMDGGFAEFVLVPARGLCPVDHRGAYELAELSVVADAVTTPYQAVARSGLRDGELAVVVGVGGVGTYCVQIAAALGAGVVAVDVDPQRLEVAEGLGADLTLDASSTDFRTMKARIREAAGEWGIPSHGWKVFECSGTVAGQETAFGLLTPAGVLLLVGFTLEKGPFRLSNLMAMDATAQGTWGCLPELYPDALAMVTSGQITLDGLIETHPLSAGPRVLESFADHRLARRAILVPDTGERHDHA
jgi:6-hydroxycyclohex-1-ene-1-carbonyl-CoA dehydrogenase